MATVVYREKKDCQFWDSDASRCQWTIPDYDVFIRRCLLLALYPAVRRSSSKIVERALPSQGQPVFQEVKA